MPVLLEMVPLWVVYHYFNLEQLTQRNGKSILWLPSVRCFWGNNASAALLRQLNLTLSQFTNKGGIDNCWTWKKDVFESLVDPSGCEWVWTYPLSHILFIKEFPDTYEEEYAQLEEGLTFGRFGEWFEAVILLFIHVVLNTLVNDPLQEEIFSKLFTFSQYSFQERKHFAAKPGRDRAVFEISCPSIEWQTRMRILQQGIFKESVYL